MPETTTPLCQLIKPSHVKRVVQVFYSRLLQHPTLGQFFQHIENFEEHEQRIADFWWITMGGQPEPRPKIDMIGKHLPLGITENDLGIWLTIFRETVAQHIDPVAAEIWINNAEQIAQRIRQLVIQQQGPGIPISKPESDYPG